MHMSSCSMSNGLYVFNTTEVFLWHINLAIVDFGDRILKTLNGINLLLLAVSILYFIQVLFWLVLNTNLVNTTDFILSEFVLDSM